LIVSRLHSEFPWFTLKTTGLVWFGLAGLPWIAPGRARGDEPRGVGISPVVTPMARKPLPPRESNPGVHKCKHANGRISYQTSPYADSVEIEYRYTNYQ